MNVLGVPVDDDCDVVDAVKVVTSLTRLEKLDFWMRNPDYLADELMTEYEEHELPEPVVRAHVSRMLGAQAAGHHYPMMRYKYGAYEPVDNALAKLRAYALIMHRRGADTGDRARHDYYLLKRGEEVFADMRATVTTLSWWEQQAEAVAYLRDAYVGSTAKQRQYEQPEYRDAPLGSDIPAIFDRVRERATRLSLLEEDA
ncbi:hypothetical protein DEJ33_05035 [Curtobacterium sp. MCPF17_047]|nr:hypothetical protein DEJ24_06380 [Curtobacterium sp. MCPF17_001]PZF67826.1 hypothetical protein DEJ33_05035 [Curtobacterium sp. MCPF17_047]